MSKIFQSKVNVITLEVFAGGENVENELLKK